MRTWTVSRISSQLRRTASRAISAASTRPCRPTSSRASSPSFPCPTRNTRWRVSPGARVTETCSAAQGSSPAPKRPERALPRRRRRLGQGTVAAEERQSISGRRAQLFARVGESHAPREFLVVGIPGQDRSGRGVELGHHVPALARPRRPEHPLVVGEHAQATRPAAVVREREQREFHRVFRVDEHLEVVAQAVRDAGEPGQPGGMPDHEATVPSRAGHRARRGGPGLSGLVVADEERLGRGVGYGVVGETASGGSRGCSPTRCRPTPKP